MDNVERCVVPPNTHILIWFSWFSVSKCTVGDTVWHVVGNAERCVVQGSIHILIGLFWIVLFVMKDKQNGLWCSSKPVVELVFFSSQNSIHVLVSVYRSFFQSCWWMKKRKWTILISLKRFLFTRGTCNRCTCKRGVWTRLWRNKRSDWFTNFLNVIGSHHDHEPIKIMRRGGEMVCESVGSVGRSVDRLIGRSVWSVGLVRRSVCRSVWSVGLIDLPMSDRSVWWKGIWSISHIWSVGRSIHRPISRDRSISRSVVVTQVLRHY